MSVRRQPYPPLLNRKGKAGEFITALDPTDYAKAQALREEYDGTKQDLQELYAEWEELAG